MAGGVGRVGRGSAIAGANTGGVLTGAGGGAALTTGAGAGKGGREMGADAGCG